MKEIFRIKVNGEYEVWDCEHVPGGWCLDCAQRIVAALLKGRFKPKLEAKP